MKLKSALLILLALARQCISPEVAAVRVEKIWYNDPSRENYRADAKEK